MNTQKGILRLIDCEEKDGNCKSFYVFICDNGQVIEDLSNFRNAPINEHIEVSIKSSKIIWWDWSERPMADKNVMDKDIALVKVVSPGHDNSDNRLAAAIAARNLEHFLRVTNDELWQSVQVTPYVLENLEEQTLGLYSFNYEIVEDRLREQHPDKFDFHNYFHGWGGIHSSYNGLAFVGGHEAWTWLSGNERTIFHETGHNLGCRHSSSLSNEYGHLACIMGRAYTGFCAPQMALMGQIRSEDIEYAEDDNAYFLCPIEVPKRDLREGELKGLMLSEKEGTGTFLLSTRKTKDQSVAGGANKEGVIYIEKVIRTFNTQPVYLGTLEAGESQEIGGYYVKNDGALDGVVRLKLGSANSVEFPEAFELPEGEEIEDGVSGVWNNSDYDHQGLEVFVDGNNVFGFWFTYHPHGEHSISPVEKHNGKEFFTFYGHIKGGNNVAEIDIYSVHGEEKTLNGKGTLRFNGESLHFRFYTKTYGRDSIRLSKLTSLRNSPSGIWKSGNYEGYTLAKYQIESNGENHDYFVVYHYFHSSFQNVDWNVYTGYDRNNLNGVSTFSKYKADFTERQEEIGTISVDWVMDTFERVHSNE